ncbi:PREDICTED: methyltransferase-like protein 7A isoform X2 [Tarenaya hassleriana]|uniref:methyltransferase-like protein 7A isoform X2 n=1 Tax=Tarenaya hassleriana TaxID=28532 RepID=UPI00053C9C97|nr:PREDICTED: methyltransferase-like protein 7A isoform X2 [Tarenaya hassleriana]
MQILNSPLSPPILSAKDSTRGMVRSSRDYVRVGTQKNHAPTQSSFHNLCSCGKRHFLEATATTPFLPIRPSLHASGSTASGSMVDSPSPCLVSYFMDMDMRNTTHPRRPDWYQGFFAWFLSKFMASYEAEVASYKMKLFDKLVGKAEKVLEIGIGTGPNLKYYAGNKNVSVYGVDPNPMMEKYARESAAEAGLEPEKFRFIHAVGESIPLDDASVDAVIGTLVLCSVSDVAQTLSEIKRVLRPGGAYLFIEHVAAEDGSILRFVQNVLDPLQQVVMDGCHLTRRTGEYILEAGFNGGQEINKISVHSIPHVSSHVYGVAHK